MFKGAPADREARGRWSAVQMFVHFVGTTAASSMCLSGPDSEAPQNSSLLSITVNDTEY